jgi:hypothetical protein
MTNRRGIRCAFIGVAAALAFAASIAQAENGHSERNACVATASLQHRACELGAIEDAKIGRAVCTNLSDKTVIKTCTEEVIQARIQANELCDAQFEARDDVCDALPRGPYDPTIDPAKFVDEITNLYAPFTPGSHWVYETSGQAEVEHIVIDVLETTREILGVACTTVSDKVYVDGVLIEDTLDYLAQDVAGNVWYFGELSQSFEDGLIAGIEGSFIAGINGAKPGFWMKAAPVAGETYRQEWALGEAEDMATIVTLNADVEAPFENGQPILKVREFTPISPGAVEFKYFVPGVGFVLEENPASGERLELIEYTPG